MEIPSRYEESPSSKKIIVYVTKKSFLGHSFEIILIKLIKLTL